MVRNAHRQRSFSCDMDALLLFSSRRPIRRNCHAGRFSVALVSLMHSWDTWRMFAFSCGHVKHICCLSASMPSHILVGQAHENRYSQLLVGSQVVWYRRACDLAAF